MTFIIFLVSSVVAVVLLGLLGNLHVFIKLLGDVTDILFHLVNYIGFIHDM